MAFIYQRRVAFADTDAAGVVHFARLLCYVEEAEHALLAELQIPLMGEGSNGEGGGGWPRVHVDCDYFSPVLPSDDVEVILILEKLGRTSVSWKFNILCDGSDVAKGSVKAVRVNAVGRPTELHPAWRDALAAV